jgi:methyl-accepting chemotaxis protein
MQPTADDINNALKKVRAAKEQIQPLRGNYPGDSERGDLIETAFWQLDEIEGDLLLRQLDDCVDELDADSKSLNSLADKMKKDIAGLESIAQGIETAAKAIGTIVDIIEKVSAVV